MITAAKKQELYMGPTFTVANVRDLSPETEYEISLFALKGLTPSKPQVVNEKTQPVKVSTGKMLTTSFINAYKSLFTPGVKLRFFDWVKVDKRDKFPFIIGALIHCFSPILAISVFILRGGSVGECMYGLFLI